MISKANVLRLKAYIKEKNLKNITTLQKDIVKGELPKEEFDLVYTHGIVQHFSHTGKGLFKIIKSLNQAANIQQIFQYVIRLN